MEDFEVEEEVRPDFSCPYCGEEFDIASLCLHLEADHPYESKSTVSCFFFDPFLYVSSLFFLLQ